jgi:hypothetical protein
VHTRATTSADVRTESKSARDDVTRALNRRGGEAAKANRLALIRAFCTFAEPVARLKSPPVHNFFRSAKAAVSDAAIPPTMRVCVHRNLLMRACKEICDSAKTHIPWVFLYHAAMLKKICMRRKFFRALQRRRSRRIVRAHSGSGAYTQN